MQASMARGGAAGPFFCNLMVRLMIAMLPLAAAAAASAGELTILSGGAAKAALSSVMPELEARAGQPISAQYAPVGRIMAQLAEGAMPDLVVITEDVFAEAAAKGYVDPASKVEVGRVGIGLAVKAGAPKPDISTPDAFKATLLAAKSIIMIDPKTGTSGKHLATVFADLGIADALAQKTQTLPGGFVVEKVASGEVEIGLHQMTEMLPVAGIAIVGPLPPSLQKVTVYVAAIGGKARQPEAARAILAALRTPGARALIARQGYYVD